jgi:hypothetical protein
VADPGTSLITHRYIYFAGTLLYPQTTSERLARLNGIAAVFEFDVDEKGKVVVKTYERK